MSNTYAVSGRRFSFNGRSSTEFGMIASGEGVHNAAERDLKRISIAGRNGDLIQDNGRYKNITISYPVAIFKDFARNADAAKTWLMADSNYHQLSDGYYPDYFRLAVFSGPIDFDMQLQNRIGQTTLKFDCKPQRFLYSGLETIPFNAPGELRNDYFPALPLITVHGTGDGTVAVGDTVVRIIGQTDTIVLDCDLLNAYHETVEGVRENRNSCISAPAFPTLLPGVNTIGWTGGVERLEIIPRWWTL